MTKKGVEQRRRAETSRETVELKRRALEMGFNAVGVASLEPNGHAGELDAWLAAGYAGTMSYLHRQSAKRKQPARIMPGAKVAVVTLTNYFHGSTDPGALPRGSAKVAQYAQSADYHRVLGHRLEQLAAAIRDIAPWAQTRVYVDAGPVPERELAQRAGLGWIAKNMMLIHPELGSFTFIGVILTDARSSLRPRRPRRTRVPGNGRGNVRAMLRRHAARAAGPPRDAAQCRRHARRDGAMSEEISEIQRRLADGLAKIDPHHRLLGRPVHYRIIDGTTLEITYRDVPGIAEGEVLGVKRLLPHDCFCSVSPQTAECVTVRFVVSLK